MGCGSSSQVAVGPGQSDPAPNSTLRQGGSYEAGVSKEGQAVHEGHVQPKITDTSRSDGGKKQQQSTGIVKGIPQQLPGSTPMGDSGRQQIQSSTGGSGGGEQPFAATDSDAPRAAGPGGSSGTRDESASPTKPSTAAAGGSATTGDGRSANAMKETKESPGDVDGSGAGVAGTGEKGGDGSGDASAAGAAGAGDGDAEEGAKGGADEDASSRTTAEKGAGTAAEERGNAAASGAGGDGDATDATAAGGEGEGEGEGEAEGEAGAVPFKDYGEAQLPEFDPQHGTGTAGSVPLKRIGGSINDVYKLEKILGKGSFGEVWRAYKIADGPESQRFAIKKIKPDVRSVAKKAARKVVRASTVARRAMQLANAAATRRASEGEGTLDAATKAAALAAVKQSAAAGGKGKGKDKDGDKPSEDEKAATGFTDGAGDEDKDKDKDKKKSGEGAGVEVVAKGGAGDGKETPGKAGKALGGKFAGSKVVEDSKSNGHHEADIMNRVRGHDSVVEVQDLLEDDMHVYIAMEYCSGGDLMKYVMRSSHFSEKVASFLFRQMLEGIAWCHSRGVVHRDLKPDNFLFASTEGRAHLKIADFGLATKIDKVDDIMTDGVGSAFFLAPEVLQRRYTSACDVWSLGVNLYLLLSGTVPFGASATKAQDVYRSIRNDTLNFSGGAWNKISAPARELVSGLLEKQPYRRYTIAQALNHPWVRSDGVAPDVPLDTNIVTSMRNFNANNKLRREAIRLVSSTLSAEDLQKLRAQFHAIDRNTDLCISVEEMSDALRKMGLVTAASGVKDLMTTIDADGDGLVDLDEFIQATAELQMINHQNNIWWAFCQYDVNGDGVLGIDEVREVLKGENEEKLKEYIELNDRDRDGVISYEEFIRMLVPPDMEFQTISFA